MNTREAADQATTILEMEVFKEAVESIRKRHRAAFENSTPEQSDAREKAYHMLKAVTQVVSELEAAITDNEIEKGRHRAND